MERRGFEVVSISKSVNLQVPPDVRGDPRRSRPNQLNRRGPES